MGRVLTKFEIIQKKKTKKNDCFVWGKKILIVSFTPIITVIVCFSFVFQLVLFFFVCFFLCSNLILIFIYILLLMVESFTFFNFVVLFLLFFFLPFLVLENFTSEWLFKLCFLFCLVCWYSLFFCFCKETFTKLDYNK